MVVMVLLSCLTEIKDKHNCKNYNRATTNTWEKNWPIGLWLVIPPITNELYLKKYNDTQHIVKANIYSNLKMYGYLINKIMSSPTKNKSYSR